MPALGKQSGVVDETGGEGRQMKKWFRPAPKRLPGECLARVCICECKMPVEAECFIVFVFVNGLREI